MKKFVSVILVLILCLQLTAYAAENKSADVKGTYVSGQKPTTVYSVDISWEGLDFTYHEAGAGVWNPQTHSYEGKSEAHWGEGVGTITLTNHSNAAVTADASYTAKAGFETADMQFSSASLPIASADNGVDGAPGTAQVGTITVTPTGTLPAETASTVIGTITIQIR